MADVIYLDNHATTAVDPRVLDHMLPYFSQHIGNASSTSHTFGTDAAKAVQAAREQVAAAIVAEPDEVIFTSGATESNNLAIKGALRGLKPGSHVIVSAAEHRAVLDPAVQLRRDGVEVSIASVDQYGRVSPESVEGAMRPETVLVSVMHVNNEVGTINPIAEISQLCSARGVLFHCDAAQSLGRVDVDLRATDIDFLSLSAHKAYGPKGVGALVVRRDRRRTLAPLFHGGGHEKGLRSGTVPVPLAVGFGTAAELAAVERSVDEERIRDLRDRLWERLRAAFPTLVLNGHAQHRVAGNLNFSVPDIDGDVLHAAIDGIAISAGSACSSSSREPSHVLRAMGRSSRAARASLRIGLGRFSTRQEIQTAGDAIAAAIRQARP